MRPARAAGRPGRQSQTCAVLDSAKPDPPGARHAVAGREQPVGHSWRPVRTRHVVSIAEQARTQESSSHALAAVTLRRDVFRGLEGDEARATASALQAPRAPAPRAPAPCAPALRAPGWAGRSPAQCGAAPWASAWQPAPVSPSRPKKVLEADFSRSP